MSSIKRELFNGVFFSAISKYAYIFINLIVTAILARLLTPEDFGVVAIATVFINFFSMLSDMGIGPAVIQRKDLTKNDLNSIFSLTVFIGLFLSIIFFFCAPLFSSYYKNESLLIIIQLLSVSIFFHCINIVPASLLNKNKQFSFSAYTNVIVQLVGGAIALSCAFCGGGVISLIIQPIVCSLLTFIVFFRKYPQSFSLTIHVSSISKILSYSTYQFLFSFLNYFTRNLDKLFVGKCLNVTELGYYEKSYRLMMLPVGNLSHVMLPAIQPIFSEFQDNKKLLYDRSLKIFKFLSIGFPISVFLFFCSEEMILIVFGEQWLPAVKVFKILTISTGFQVLYSPQSAFFQSANAVKQMLNCGMIVAILNIIAVIVGCVIFVDLSILSYSIVVSYILSFLITYYVLIKKVYEHSFIEFLGIFVKPFIVTLSLIVSYVISSYIIEFKNPLLSCFYKGLIFTIILGVSEYRTIYNIVKTRFTF